MNTIPAIVTSDEDVVENIINFNKEVLLYNQETQTSAIATLVDNISHYRAWYCLLDSNTNKYLFAPSKYIGYKKMSAEIYAQYNRAGLDGRKTESSLAN